MPLSTFTPVHEPLNLGDLLKYEAPNLYSRDQVTIAPNQNLALGQVVGRLTDSAQIAAFDPAASDGRENAIGVMIAAITTADEPSNDGLMIARHATFADHALIWPATLTAEQRAAAIAQLRALGLLVRRGV
jgi:hypothetical protein